MNDEDLDGWMCGWVDGGVDGECMVGCDKKYGW